jgi:hypothetical protein
MDMQTLRIGIVLLLAVLLYGSRMTKGTAKTTPEGLSFGMKLFVVVTRLIALAVYVGFYFYTVRTAQHPLPIWVPSLFVVIVLFAALQLPGTIVLGPESLTQKFWLRAAKTIRYDEVMAITSLTAGRAIRVVGDNRVVITHTNNYAAAEEFKAEMTRRTGKPIS